MNHLVFSNDASTHLRAELLATDLESAAIVLATPVQVRPVSWRLLVNDVRVVPPDKYGARSKGSIVLPPEYLVPVIKKARISGRSIILVHTHPWPGEVHASPVDREGEAVLL